MGQKFHLQIPTPCHQDWATMTPEAQGRFCGSCRKTVVDFTSMSDREVIGYLARTGQGVCGRFDPDQLNRNYSLRPESPKKRGLAWQWLLAGVLFSTRLPAQTRAAKAVVNQERPQKPGENPTGPDASFRGKAVLVAPPDSVPKPVADTFKMLPEVVVTAEMFARHRTTLGLTATITTETFSRKRAVTDTLKALCLLPAKEKELSVYPNPVNRGNAVSLSWQTEPGTYRVQLFNIAGALVQQRVMEVESKEQVDLLEIPPGVAAGAYVIRAAREGNGKVYTRKLVIR